MKRFWALVVTIVVCGMLDVSVDQAALAASAKSHLKPVGFNQLEGWDRDDHQAALETFIRSCRRWQKLGGWKKPKSRFAGSWRHWSKICKQAQAVSEKADARAARAFFEEHFLAVKVRAKSGEVNLFTGYFEPELRGSRQRSARYPVPLFRKPDDLVAFSAKTRKKTGLRYGRIVKGRAKPYFTRREIEQGALAGRNLEFIWVETHADAFFMQVQGSGRIRLDNDEVVRIAYGGKTGLPYTAVGAVLIKRGIIAREKMSMQAIRAWMALNPEQARELMWHNESFVFFREKKLPRADLGPPGAQSVQVTPGRTLAVDHRYWPYIMPMWLETSVPATKDTSPQAFNRLMVAQDTGTAIKGIIRGDIFFGAGIKAAAKAGHMKNPGRLFALLPKAVAGELGLIR